MNSKWTKKLVIFINGWFIGYFIWRLIRGFDFTYDQELLNITVSPIIFLLIQFGFVVLAGSTFGTLQYIYEKFSLASKSKSFRTYILQSMLIHLGLMVGIYFLIYWVISLSGFYGNTFMEFITTKLILANLVYSFLINSVIIIVIQINLLLGKGNLKKLIMGRFHTPKEEKRAFMFMDLKGSTTIAEQLGHLKYSSFIQDCFYFLSVMDSYNINIYQYVGDEVVLSWNLDKDDHLEDFIIAFNAYEGILKDKNTYFETKYGIQPVFKAGLHIGPVTVVEVGSIKREIAYHGDTINVASRIQEQCKIFNSSLLISEDAYERVKGIKGHTFKNVGDFALRGRKNSIQLYDVIAK